MNNFSLDDLARLLGDRDVAQLILRKSVITYTDFIKQLYADLGDAIQHPQHNRHRYQRKEFGEDDISAVLITFLKGRNYDAEPDTQHGGHADIVVKSNAGRWEWTGEAKLWKGKTWIMKGWKQLADSYTTATDGESHSGLLIYIKQEHAKTKMDLWKDHYESTVTPTSVSYVSTSSLNLDSTHVNRSSGLNQYVRHFGICLWHKNCVTPEYDEDGNEI
jgi:hypothetical protein